MNEALDRLRNEIQTDRIELQRTIREGFDGINKKFDEKFDKQAEDTAEIDKRLSLVENTQRHIVRGITGAVTAIFTAAVGWISGLFRS